MTIQRHIHCDACNHAFWQEVEKRSAPLPDPSACPYCGGTGEHTEEVIQWISKEKREANRKVQQWVEEGRAPGYNGTRARDLVRSEEQVFRAMEAGSMVRAEAAASELNIPVSEMSNIKITDMHDRPKQGEISAKIPLSMDGQNMAAQARQMSFNANSNAAEFAKAGGTVINGSTVGTHVGVGAKTWDPVSGRAATPGMAAQSLLQRDHASRAAVVESRALKRG